MVDPVRERRLHLSPEERRPWSAVAEGLTAGVGYSLPLRTNSRGTSMAHSTYADSPTRAAASAPADRSGRRPSRATPGSGSPVGVSRPLTAGCWRRWRSQWARRRWPRAPWRRGRPRRSSQVRLHPSPSSASCPAPAGPCSQGRLHRRIAALRHPGHVVAVPTAGNPPPARRCRASRAGPAPGVLDLGADVLKEARRRSRESSWPPGSRHRCSFESSAMGARSPCACAASPGRAAMASSSSRIHPGP